LNGKTAHGSKLLDRVRITKYPDHLDMLPCHNSEVASWKRLAITILKNDHTCKYLGLAPTKQQMERQKLIMLKYRNIGITGRKRVNEGNKK
jgi:predicted phosphoadenosine phosphosulfate sulfurtransferase